MNQGRKRVGIVGAQLHGMKNGYNKLAHRVAKQGYKVQLFVYVPDGNEKLCSLPDARKDYEKQMRKLERCDLIIAYVGEVVTEVVVQIEHANTKGIPVVLFHRTGRKVSPLLLGGPTVQKVYQYNKNENVMDYVEDMLQYIHD